MQTNFNNVKLIFSEHPNIRGRGLGIRRIKRNKTYTPEQLAWAVEAVKSGRCTIRHAQNTFGVPRSTIFGVLYRMKKQLASSYQNQQDFGTQQ
jgi:hypothetical protein